MAHDTRYIQATIATFNFISEIPAQRRSADQKKELDVAIEVLRVNFHEFFEALTQNLLVEVEKYELKEREWNDILKENRPPAMQDAMTDHEIDLLISVIYERQNAVAGILEVLESKYARFLDYEKRAERTIQALCAFEKEWKSKAVFNVYLPLDTFLKIRTLGEFVALYNSRIDTLNHCYERLSRRITIRQGVPIEPTTRFGEQEYRKKSSFVATPGAHKSIRDL